MRELPLQCELSTHAMQERVWLRTNGIQPLRISAPNQSKGLQSSLNSNLFGKCVESSGFGTSFAPKTVTASSNKEVNMDFSHSKKRARQSLRAHVSRLGLALALTTAAAAIQAADTIKVGVLHSLSGTMAISETTLKDTVLMLIEEQNKKGGVLGKMLEPVVVDPASNWPCSQRKHANLSAKTKWLSPLAAGRLSRASLFSPVYEELNSLLFYPVQYEGEESSKNVFYTGAAPNQQAIPAVDYLMNEVGVKRWVLAGTDYVYPRTTNKILKRT